jgi:hypothetical protein
MPVRIAGDRLLLSGVVSIEEAEALRDLLSCHPGASLDLAACEHLHTAALQALFAARRAVVSPPADAFLAAWILPELAARAAPSLPSSTPDLTS